MHHAAMLLATSLATLLPGQTVSVAATGTLEIMWQGSGAVQSMTQPVSGSTTLQNITVASATLTVGPTTTLVLDASSPPGGFGWWSSASGDVLVSYSASTAVAGVLRLNITPACLVGPPPMTDVEDDGLFEAMGTYGPIQVDVPVVLGPRPIPVRITGETVNFGGATCVSTSSVAFVPTPTDLETAGVACGPSLAASLSRPLQQPGMLVLHVDDDVAGPSSIAAAIAFGATSTTMRASCNPGLVPDGWVLVTPQAGGFDLPVPLATGLTGSIHLQHVALQLPFTLQLSNRLRVTLP